MYDGTFFLVLPIIIYIIRYVDLPKINVIN